MIQRELETNNSSNGNLDEHEEEYSPLEGAIQNAIETNARIGPISSSDFGHHTVAIPTCETKLQRLLAAILTVHFPSDHAEEITIDGRVLRILDQQGVALTPILDDQGIVFSTNGNGHV